MTHINVCIPLFVCTSDNALEMHPIILKWEPVMVSISCSACYTRHDVTYIVCRLDGTTNCNDSMVWRY